MTLERSVPIGWRRKPSLRGLRCRHGLSVRLQFSSKPEGFGLQTLVIAFTMRSGRFLAIVWNWVFIDLYFEHLSSPSLAADHCLKESLKASHHKDPVPERLKHEYFPGLLFGKPSRPCLALNPECLAFRQSDHGIEKPGPIDACGPVMEAGVSVVKTPLHDFSLELPFRAFIGLRCWFVDFRPIMSRLALP